MNALFRVDLLFFRGEGDKVGKSSYLCSQLWERGRLVRNDGGRGRPRSQ